MLRFPRIRVMRGWLVCLAFACMTRPACLIPGQPSCFAQEFNYDEAKVPTYALPDLLVTPDGKPIRSAQDWNTFGRDGWLQAVADEVYGHAPEAMPQMNVVSMESNTQNGITTKQVVLRFRKNGKQQDVDLLVFLPAARKSPAKIFLGLNFNGNHTVTDDPSVAVTQSWVRNNEKLGYKDNQASADARGASASRWPVDAIIERGYGLATAYYGDIDPDFHDEFQNGIHALFAGETRTATSWGSIATWAWGLSRIVDYCERDPDIDATRICLMGHSRLGKTALWAGAADPRFAVVISNNSGCGGAAVSRRRFGETVKRINTSFPHWFCDNYKKYNDQEAACPVDQHALIALVAPRPILICSAQKDRWADPKGEFLSGKAADPVYRLLGTDGMNADDWPDVNTPIMSRIGYHMRPGGHDVKLQDWHVYMDFADKHLPKGS